jgi:hypothetical protein
MTVFDVLLLAIVNGLAEMMLSVWRTLENWHCRYTGEIPRDYPPRPKWMDE